ncbi:hypothetical protein IM793_24345 [Pedobacter sp. MR2016-19]|nr:hypothetical protein [Pedobacter sp. MR2016-19]MBE5322302.1 hypothetical protein [Pedobacter sp. MR2016-19]
MKAQQTIIATKLAKKTVFVYRNIKGQNNFSTVPTEMGQSVVTTSWINAI